jgi:hypothetical protein
VKPKHGPGALRQLRIEDFAGPNFGENLYLDASSPNTFPTIATYRPPA